MAGDNQGAAAIALTGDSATGYQAAADAVTSDVEQAGDALADRIDGAEAASIPPLVPLGLGALAAGLAAAGILYRGRRYR
jgi:hypothetical protein